MTFIRQLWMRQQTGRSISGRRRAVQVPGESMTRRHQGGTPFTVVLRGVVGARTARRRSRHTGVHDQVASGRHHHTGTLSYTPHTWQSLSTTHRTTYFPSTKPKTTQSLRKFINLLHNMYFSISFNAHNPLQGVTSVFQHVEILTTQQRTYSNRGMSSRSHFLQHYNTLMSQNHNLSLPAFNR